MEEEFTLYIIINNDLHMSPGKMASQVGHVVEKITERILNMTDIPKHVAIDYVKYSRSGRKKIVLSGTQYELEILKHEKDAEYIIDEGITEIPENSLTVVGFFPNNRNKERFKKFRLL